MTLGQAQALILAKSTVQPDLIDAIKALFIQVDGSGNVLAPFTVIDVNTNFVLTSTDIINFALALPNSP